MTIDFGNTEDEIQSFITLLREIFHGEPWKFVEPCAQRAWSAGEFADTPWEHIRDRVRASWTD